MVVFIIEEMLRKQKEKEKPKVTKKDLIMAEFYNDTGISLKALAKKYKTSYQNVCNIHADFLQETE